MIFNSSIADPVIFVYIFIFIGFVGVFGIIIQSIFNIIKWIKWIKKGIKCLCSQEYINRINCHYCKYNTKYPNENYIECNYKI